MKNVKLTSAFKATKATMQSICGYNGKTAYNGIVDINFFKGTDALHPNKDFVCCEIHTKGVVVPVYSGDVEDAFFEVPDEVADRWIAVNVLEEVV